MAFFGGDGVQGKCMEEVSLNPKLGLHPKSSEIRIFGITSLSPQNVEASPMQKITFLYWRTSSNMVSKIPRQKYREARIDDWSTFFFWLRSHIIKQLIFFACFHSPIFWLQSCCKICGFFWWPKMLLGHLIIWGSAWNACVCNRSKILSWIRHRWRVV